MLFLKAILKFSHYLRLKNYSLCFQEHFQYNFNQMLITFCFCINIMTHDVQRKSSANRLFKNLHESDAC